MLRALRQCKNAFSRYYLNDDLEDVQFEFTLLDDIVIGEPFTVSLIILNKSINILKDIVCMFVNRLLQSDINI